MKVRSVLGVVASLVLATAARAQTITNIVPPIGGHGEPGQPMKIQGNGFWPGSHPPSSLKVDFNGVTSTTATNAAVQSYEIQITNIPAAATTGPIHVFINGVQAPQTPMFVVVPTNKPYATNFSPTFGGNSTPVVITGIHFSLGGVTNVLFNGVRGTGFFLRSDNEIDVNAPIGVTSGPLTLQSKLGAANNFNTTNNVITTATNFYAQAGITSFSPPSGRTGTNVILTGANFLGCSGITFAGVTANDFTISNNTTIRVSVPLGASSGKIVLSPPNGTLLGTAQSATDFKILPSISSFAPGAGITNTLVTVVGAGLNEKSPHPDVSIGGGTAVVFSTVSPGTLSFNVPTNATSGPIVITTTNGTTISDQVFYLPPTITKFTPTNGAFGTSVWIQGNNLTNTFPVAFNGVTASSFVTNNNNISAVAPVGVQSGPISVTTPFGTTNSTQLFYVQPTISGFAPTHGVAGTLVQISGNSFTNASVVSFNGTVATNFFVTNNSTLGVLVPTNATSGKITVTAPGGTGQSATDFTIDSTDLAVLVSDAPDPVFVTSNLVYTVIVTNNGSMDASFVTLSNALPNSVLLKAVTTPAGVLVDTNHNPIAFSLGALAANTSATVTITVAPQIPGTITNTAFVGSTIPDSNLANNVASVTTTVWPLPFLSITNLMTNDLMRISWPTQLSSFTLQSSTNLSTNAWLIDLTSRTVIGTNVSVIKTNLGIPTFYRLTN